VEPSSTVRLSVITVAFNSRAAFAASLPPLLDQLRPADELVVVDNASSDGTVDAVRRAAPDAIVVENSANVGFAAACGQGAERASGELLLFLNPDAAVAPGFADAIRRPLAERPAWAAWMGLVTMDGGRRVNTTGGVVHFTGIAWAGESGRPVTEVSLEPHEVGFVSGACLAVPREVWLREGGFPAAFFMYCEDVDLSLRLRLSGKRIGIEPRARVDHDYAFLKGAAKWRMLERNRWATVIRTYPGPLLGLLAPALLLTELAVLAAAVSGGWGPAKAGATADTLRALPRLLRERRAIQAARRISPAAFARGLTADLSSPYLGRPAALGPLRWALRAYWGLVIRVLGAISR